MNITRDQFQDAIKAAIDAGEYSETELARKIIYENQHIRPYWTDVTKAILGTINVTIGDSYHG